MSGLELGDFVTEYYEVTHSDIFKSIVSHTVQSIEFVAIKGEDPPFGVKILFEDDYVLVTSISDGTTVETARFNKLDNVRVFEKLGAIEYRTTWLT